MMAGALRGSTAATLGLPGDIENLGRGALAAARAPSGQRLNAFSSGMEQPTVLPTTERMMAALPKATPVPTPYEELGQFAPLPGSATAAKALSYGAGRAAGAGTRAVGQAISDAMIHQAGPLASGPLSALAPRAAMTNVVKPKGGNWLSGGVERSVAPLTQDVIDEDKLAGLLKASKNPKISETTRNDLLQAHADEINKRAMNNWVERNLTNYIKKEMATPEDPVRKLAEQGIVHMPPEQMGYGSSQAYAVRKKLGAPKLAQSEAAQAWEDATDVSMYPYTIEDIKKAKDAGGPFNPNWMEPWMESADPSTKVFMPLDNMNASDLGFDHIVDVLKQDLASGRIRPEQLNKVSMEQAVRRTYEYDQEMAKKMAEAQIKATEGMPVHKEYPEGYKWIELAPPKELPAGHSVVKDEMSGSFKVVDANGKEAVNRLANNLGHTNVPFHRTEEEAIAEALKHDKRLEEALKYEGDTMGHCVGNYCRDVAAGKSRIYSLRDAKGEPHVTVEVQPSNVQEALRNLPAEERHALAQSVKDQHFGGVMPGVRDEDKYWEMVDQAYIDKYGTPAPTIKQIKGKQNRAPKEEYLPYVQDFVKGGKWSDVGDLHNTGLRRTSDAFNEAEQAFLKSKGVELNPYIEPEETARYQEMFKRSSGVLPEEDMATGGVPKPPSDEIREKLRQLRDSFVPLANEFERQKKIQDNLEKMNKKISFSDNPDSMMMDVEEAQMAGGGDVRGYDNGGSIKATPRSEGWGMAADVAKAIEDASKEQFGYKNPATEVIADLLGIPAVARTLERKAYGEPITNIGKANVPLLPDDTAETLMTVAPLAKPAAKGAKAAGKLAASEIEKAMFGESSSKLLNEITPQVMSAYRPHTPLKPDPDVGTRYKKEYIGGLAPRKDLDIEDLERQKASVKIFPWDATSRNQLISEVSEVPLTKPVLTEGGDEYMMDLEHIKNRIAGASNEGIAKRIQDRTNQASVENRVLGGSGRVYGFSARMGEGAENAATFPADIAMDLLKQGGLNKKEMKALDKDFRTMMFEGERGAFKDMAPIGTPEFEQQLRTGLKGDKAKNIQGFTAMNLRKALMDRLGKVEYQKRLGYNLPDLIGAVLSDELKGVPKGYVGNVAAELDPFTQIRPSKSSAYSHDFGGVYAGGIPNMPLEFLMPNTYERIYREMKIKYPKATPEALRNMTIGAMEKRKEGISEMISPRSVDATKIFQEGLMKGEFDPNNIKEVYDYMLRKKLQLKLKEGGEITVKPKKMAGGGEITAEDLDIEERPL